MEGTAWTPVTSIHVRTSQYVDGGQVPPWGMCASAKGTSLGSTVNTGESWVAQSPFSPAPEVGSLSPLRGSQKGAEAQARDQLQLAWAPVLCCHQPLAGQVPRGGE